MNLRSVFLPLLAFSILSACTARQSTNSAPDETIRVRNDFKKHFEECQVDGSIVIFDQQKQQWILSDTVGSAQETLPASTFKIINLLIALETGAISDENEVIKWNGQSDTVKYGYRPETYRDLTVKEGFEISAVWVFEELARRVGRDQYTDYLKRSNYGNMDFSQKEIDFWNFGSFGVSPVEQVRFLRNLYEEKLPFSKRSIDIVKRVMIAEQTEDYTVRGKTGWTTDHGMNTGWWVGYVENSDGVYFFATRLLQDRKNNRPDFAACRKEITRDVLQEMEILP